MKNFIINNKKYIALVLTFCICLCLIFINNSSFFNSAKADEINSDTTIETTPTISLTAEDIVNGITFVGYYPLDNCLTYNPSLSEKYDYLDSVGLLVFIPHEYYNISGFEYGHILTRRENLIKHNITDKYLEQFDSYGVSHSNLVEDYSSLGNQYKTGYGYYSYCHQHFDDTETSAFWVDNVYIYYVKNLSTGEIAYSAEHVFSPSKITKDYIDSVIDLSDYISVETYEKEISKLNDEIKKLKDSANSSSSESSNKNNSALFVTLSIVLGFVLIVIIVSLIPSKNKKKM